MNSTSIVVLQSFKYAHGGHTVQEFTPSDKPVDTSDECAALAVEQGWAKLAADVGKRALRAAPENKDAATVRKTKGK